MCRKGVGGQVAEGGEYTNTVVCMLSGGFDSPVAAFNMMKRGCRVILVHFQNVNQMTQAGTQDKITQLAKRLAVYQAETILYIVPFARMQERIILNVNSTHRMLVYRLFMMRIATSIARLVTQAVSFSTQ